MTVTLADAYDARLYARARHEAVPTGALFTAPQRPTPITAEQQRLNFEALRQAISSPHQAAPSEPNPAQPQYRKSMIELGATGLILSVIFLGVRLDVRSRISAERDRLISSCQAWFRSG